ncbi:NYN domain-containing protein [Candidatus Uhrbacteria bacterium UHB]|nr:NYN domain-containing protein [Candidatus Uhrbacteria bacterium UHB]RIL00219.1 MAG: hypothetical protein DCC77_04685 [Candidatus Uhrbacteria bacterium]
MPMIKRPDQRVVVLIDTQNMYHSAKHLYGAHLNFPKLVEMITEDRKLIRAIAYAATSKGGEERGFLDALKASGIECKTKDVQEFASGERKADWDVGMAVDAITLSERADVVALVTGDGDFVPLVQYLKNKGIGVIVAAFGESTSKMLREAADEYFDISDHPVELLMAMGAVKVNRAARVQPSPSHPAPSAPKPAEPAKQQDLPRDASSRKKGGRPDGSGKRQVRVTI